MPTLHLVTYLLSASNILMTQLRYAVLVLWRFCLSRQVIALFPYSDPIDRLGLAGTGEQAGLA